MNFADIEQKILEFWKKKDIFAKNLFKNEGKKNFVFFEGPPTANGRPGMHHVEARAFKDIIPRYKTMRGFFVDRKAGWDTHGLPVELEVEKALGLKDKKDIEKYGIDKFNQKCKESVWKYKDEWEKLTERIAFWLDMKNPYITYENYYIESLWFILKKVWEKGLMYKGFKVVPHCPRCVTTLSSHEVAQGYKKVKENSVYVKFKIKPSFPQMRGGIEGGVLGDGQTAPPPTPSSPPKADPPLAETEEGRDLNNTYFLVWTTTPWTLPANVALAVGNDIEYVEIVEGPRTTISSDHTYSVPSNERYVIAKEIFAKKDQKVVPGDVLSKAYYFDGKIYRIIKTIKGKDLVGIEYEPLFENSNQKENDLRVVAGDFVSTEDGTGIVHLAPAYGEDDLRVGEKENLSVIHTVDQGGIILTDFDIPGEGRFIKQADKDIIENLKKRNLIFKEESYEHDYPFCWRCDSPLIYYAKDSWFIKMSDLRDKLVANNKKINWEPAYIRDGRFGEFIREVKDWAISRERYWGTPLPIWTCEKCAKTEAIGSISDIKKRIESSGNKYFVMRHGQAENNVKNILNGNIEKNHFNLTEKGKEEVAVSAKKLEKGKIDLIFSSDFLRTKQTAELAAETIGLDKRAIIFDSRLREVNFGALDSKPSQEYQNYFSSHLEKFSKNPPRGENLTEIKKRMSEFLYEINGEYSGKNILIVSHEYPIWQMFAGAESLSNEEAINLYGKKGDFIGTGQFMSMDFVVLPHDENFVLDLHRPYIDEIKLECGCGGKMAREKDVVDVWFDSGAMPFAQWGYPERENSEKELKAHYPADYISEAIDQTRGWFYTLLAVATLMEECGVAEYGAPYKNVICLGHVLDAKGKKMSKSKGNVVSPWEMCDKFGADTLRWYLYTVNSAGDSKKFDVKDVQDKNRRVFGTLFNSLIFFQTYAGKDFLSKRIESKNILDKWIISVFNSTTEKVIKNLEKYDITSAARIIEDFIDDLSNWHIRRSRERFQKPKTKTEKQEATQTLHSILIELAKLIAPFAPFMAEYIYRELNNYCLSERSESKANKRKSSAINNPSTSSGNKIMESVHLCDYPKPEKRLVDKRLEDSMKKAREIVAKALALRMEKKIKIRQPLASLKIKNQKRTSSSRTRAKIKNEPELLKLIEEEINVKQVIFDGSIKNEIELDTEITEELKEEGVARELVRQIQQMRKEAGLVPQDVISIMYNVSSIKHQEIFKNWEKYIKQETNSKSFEPYKEGGKFDLEKEINLDGGKVKVGITKK